MMIRKGGKIRVIFAGVGIVGLFLILVFLASSAKFESDDKIHFVGSLEEEIIEEENVDVIEDTGIEQSVVDDESEVFLNDEIEVNEEEGQNNILVEETITNKESYVDPEKDRIDEFLNEGYESWYSTLRNRINSPRLGFDHSIEIEDVLNPEGAEDQIYFMSYDPRSIEDDSYVAEILYKEAFAYGQNEAHRFVFTFKWDADKGQFVYPSGVHVLLLPGTRISFDKDTARRNTLGETPYYKQYSYTSSRYGSAGLPDDATMIYEQQLVNFKAFFFGEGDNYVTPDGYITVSSGTKVEISKFLKTNAVYEIIGLRTLAVKPVEGIVFKIVWNPYIDTYVYESGFEVKLNNGDRLVQVAENDEFDIDGLRSVGYVDYGNHVSGCTRTKRLNGYQFDISLPFGEGPYKTIYKNRSNLTGYLGSSDDHLQSAGWFLVTRNNRWDMILDESRFPEGTDFIEIIFHSDSDLGKIFGHGAVAIKYADKRWMLDPYVRVPGYGEEEPKELNDWVASERAATHLGVSKVFYFDSNVDIVGMSRDELVQYVETL